MDTIKENFDALCSKCTKYSRDIKINLEDYCAICPNWDESKACENYVEK